VEREMASGFAEVEVQKEVGKSGDKTKSSARRDGKVK
jgi:hypothetical protein